MQPRSLTGTRNSETKSETKSIGKKSVPENLEDGFTINVTCDSSCVNFHKTQFYKPVRLYKVTNIFNNINYFSYGSIGSTRQRSKYYLPGPIKFKVAIVSFNRNLLNLGDNLLLYSQDVVKHSKIHIDQTKLEMYCKKKYDVVIAICDQTLLLSRRLGNLIYAANGMALHVIVIVLSSNPIDELASENTINIVHSKSNKRPLVMEICNKPVNSQQRFITNAIIQYPIFFELTQNEAEEYYQKIKNRK